MTGTIASTRTSTVPAPAEVRSVDLAGPAGRLEAVVNEGAADAPFAALICHPHPKGGGNMHNKVVYHAMKALNDAAWGLAVPVLRFNFRGTGLSQGEHHGKLEAEDVLAAMDWLENEYKRPLVVGGFSFGAAMALKACCCYVPNRPPVRALVALGLPTQAEGHDYSYRFLADCTTPKLFLSGDQDEYAPAAQLALVADSAAAPRQLLLIPGGDHFFQSQLEPMQQALSGWIKEQLQ
ncbi:MAG TPA: alpha/beta family hydrolase [Terracidiphilus sp.]|nr:alpha/beta family hydrolase [Terracidiphilus sp.]